MAKEQFQYELKEHISTLSVEGNMQKEINLISFNGRPEKYDIRNWQANAEEKKMLKGIALSIEEAKALKAALNSRAEL